MSKFLVQQCAISLILSMVMWLFSSCWSLPPKPPSAETESSQQQIDALME